MNISLKRLLIVNRMSEETLCFTADVAVDGKTIGSVKNDGRGGCNCYYWTDRVAGEALEAYAKTVETEFKFEQLDQLLDKIITKTQEEKQYRRWCKTQIVFRLTGDKSGEWRTLKAIYNKAVHRPQLEKRYPNLEEVLNERVA